MGFKYLLIFFNSVKIKWTPPSLAPPPGSPISTLSFLAKTLYVNIDCQYVGRVPTVQVELRIQLTREHDNHKMAYVMA
jgi:hypothetical protein